MLELFSVLFLLFLIIYGVYRFFRWAFSFDNNTYKSYGTSNRIRITIIGPNPETADSYQFYKFVEHQTWIKEWYAEAQKQYTFKPEYQKAIEEAIANKKFKNPINFKEFYGTKFEYIGVHIAPHKSEYSTDRQLNNWIINYAFIRDDKHIDTDYHLFNDTDFGFIWEKYLKDFFNTNIIVTERERIASLLHMKLATCKIQDYNIRYVCINELAKSKDLPTNFKELKKFLNINIEEIYYNTLPALELAETTSQLLKMDINLEKYVHTLQKK